MKFHFNIGTSKILQLKIDGACYLILDIMHVIYKKLALLNHDAIKLNYNYVL